MAQLSSSPEQSKGGCPGKQPDRLSQVSVPLQKRPSSQSTLDPPPQAPPEQVSPVLQASPSSHGDVLSVATQFPAPSHLSSVHEFPSSEHGVPAATKQSSSVSLQPSAHSVPPAQGSPVWFAHVPPLHVSLPLQNRPSLQGSALLTAAQFPAPSHSLSVHSLPSSVHEVPDATKQLSPLSLQESAHSPPPLHGLPACMEQEPALQVSAPLQNTPSLQEFVLFETSH
jgi:hypothetical protein